MNDNYQSKSGLYILLILVASVATCMLSFVKLTGVLNISWWIVFSPMIFIYSVLNIILLVVLGVSKWKKDD